MAVLEMTTHSTVYDRLTQEERDAWTEYLEACRQALTAVSSVRYEEVEPWAWNRLQAKLRAITARRRSNR